MVLLLSEGSDVQIVSGTLRVLEIKDFRHFLFLKNHICMIQIVKILNAYLVNILLIGGRTIILRIRTVANSLLIRNISQKSANKVILIIQFTFAPACAIKLLSIDVNSGESCSSCTIFVTSGVNFFSPGGVILRRSQLA